MGDSTSTTPGRGSGVCVSTLQCHWLPTWICLFWKPSVRLFLPPFSSRYAALFSLASPIRSDSAQDAFWSFSETDPEMLSPSLLRLSNCGGRDGWRRSGGKRWPQQETSWCDRQTLFPRGTFRTWSRGVADTCPAEPRTNSRGGEPDWPVARKEDTLETGPIWIAEFSSSHHSEGIPHRRRTRVQTGANFSVGSSCTSPSPLLSASSSASSGTSISTVRGSLDALLRATPAIPSSQGIHSLLCGSHWSGSSAGRRHTAGSQPSGERAFGRVSLACDDGTCCGLGRAGEFLTRPEPLCLRAGGHTDRLDRRPAMIAGLPAREGEPTSESPRRRTPPARIYGGVRLPGLPD